MNREIVGIGRVVLWNGGSLWIGRDVGKAQLAAAYASCRSIARGSAKNFYYSFLALPRDKRNAICAVYAFMRHADDISDEPGVDAQQKRQKLGEWLDAAKAVLQDQFSDLQTVDAPDGSEMLVGSADGKGGLFAASQAAFKDIGGIYLEIGRAHV